MIVILLELSIILAEAEAVHSLTHVPLSPMYLDT